MRRGAGKYGESPLGGGASAAPTAEAPEGLVRVTPSLLTQLRRAIEKPRTQSWKQVAVSTRFAARRPNTPASDDLPPGSEIFCGLIRSEGLNVSGVICESHVVFFTGPN